MKCLFSYVKNKIPDNFCPETEQNFLILSFPVDMFSIFFCLFSPQKCPPVKIIHWNRVIFFPGKLFLLCDSKLKQKFPQKKKVLLKNVSWTFGKWKMKKKEVFSFFVCESDTKKHQDINTVCAWKGSLTLSSLIIDNYLMWKFLAIKSCQHQSEITPETLSQREGGTRGRKEAEGVTEGRTDVDERTRTRTGMKQSRSLKYWLKDIFLFQTETWMCCGRAEARRGGAAVQTQSDLTPAPISYSSESSDAGPQPTPLRVCLTLWVRASVKDFCVLALSVQTLQSHLFVSLMDRTNRGASLETLVGMKPH